MIRYRDFRTVDLPALAGMWASAFADIPGLMPFSAPLLEEWVCARPWFRPDRLRIAETAEDSPRVVGAILCGPGCDPDEVRVDPSVGVVALLGIDREFRRRGIGRELVSQVRQRLIDDGATTVLFGCSPPARPYGLGLWKAIGPFGIAESPETDSSEPEFLSRLGFRRKTAWLSLCRDLTLPVRIIDRRYAGLHRRTELISEPFSPVTPWLSGVYGPIDPLQHTLVDRKTRQVLATCTVLQLNPDREEGVVERLWVDPEFRRQGMGSLLTGAVMRQMQENGMQCVRTIAAEADAATQGFQARTGFGVEQRGWVWESVGGS